MAFGTCRGGRRRGAAGGKHFLNIGVLPAVIICMSARCMAGMYEADSSVTACSYSESESDAGEQLTTSDAADVTLSVPEECGAWQGSTCEYPFIPWTESEYPGTESVNEMEIAPESDPESMPESNPESMPESDPESMPESDPEVIQSDTESNNEPSENNDPTEGINDPSESINDPSDSNGDTSDSVISEISAPDVLAPDVLPQETMAPSFIPADYVEDYDLMGIIGAGIDPEIDPETDAVEFMLRNAPDDEGLLQLAALMSGKTMEAAQDAAEALAENPEAVSPEIKEAVEHAGIYVPESESGFADEIPVIQPQPVPESEETSSAESFSIVSSILDAFVEDVWADEIDFIWEEDEAEISTAAETSTADETEAAAESASYADERHYGSAIQYVPADSIEDAMCFVSSFELIGVNDGAGDFDDVNSYTPEGNGYDWQGHDSASDNGVVRTYDTVTYKFSYTTELCTGYIYNTVTGTRLYMECTLPAGSDEAEFYLKAMPWMLGDGADGKPVIYYTLEDGTEVTSLPEGMRAVSQRLVGYRILPDQTMEGVTFDVPGAGTIICTIFVKNARLGQEILPCFRAWLETASDNTRAPGEESGLVCTKTPEDPVRVTLGAYVQIRYVSESFARTFSRHGSCDYYDGDFGRVNDEGRIKQVRFRITVGKSNGSIKGSSPLAPDLPVRVEFTLAASASGGKDTCAGLYDIRTADMWDGTAVYAWNGTAQSMIGVTGTEVTGMEPFDGCGSLVPGSVTASGGVYSFSIMPEGNVYPGDTFSGGDILLFSRQVQSDPDSTSLQYTVRIESETLYAVSALDDTRSERAFSQYYTEDGVTLCPFYDIANTVDPGGNWHAHIYLGLEGSTTPLSGSGMYQTAGRTAYGKPFTVTVKEMLDVGDAAQSEKSRKLFVLWDNNKVELDVREGALAMVNSWDGLSGGLPSDPQTGLLNGVSGSKTRFVFLTKHDGSCWADEAEMDSAALMSYDDLYMWQTYDDACGYGEICGLLIENYGYAFDVPSENNLLSFTFGMRMKQDKGIIGTSVKFEYAIYSFLENVNTSMGGYSGIGDLPEDTPYKVWNGKLPRTYRKTEWDEQKRIISSSLSENNHPHLGTTLYVEDYAMKIASKILEGGIGSRGYESLTRDLSEANDLVYRITPAFQMISGVREADCTVVLPAPDDAEGNHVAEFKELRTIGADGTPVVLETEGREYQLSDFVPGAEGTLTVSRDDAGEYLSGISYTGDPVTGKKVVLRPAYDPSLALTYAPSGPVLSAYSAGDSGQVWQFVRHPAGGLGLVSVSSGEWLAGGMRTLANLREGAALTYNSSGDRLDNRLSVSRGDGGEITVSILGTGFALGAEDGTVCLCEGGSYEAVWYAEWSGGEADGIVISLRNISDEYALPEFYSSYILSRSLLNMNSSVTQYAYITERDPSIDTSVDMHTASTGLGFVETYAVVLFETVDRAEVSLAELSQGALIKYSVMCTNLYNELHEMNLTVPIPGNGDADGTALAESAMVNVVSIHAEGDSGSEVTVSSVADAVSAGEITAHSVLKPGETVTVTYEAAVSGAAPGNVLRNSAVQEDAFGTERSNRTQTVITGLDETAHRMTLSAGGGGAGTFVILGVLFAALAGFFGVTGVRAF